MTLIKWHDSQNPGEGTLFTTSHFTDGSPGDTATFEQGHGPQSGSPCAASAFRNGDAWITAVWDFESSQPLSGLSWQATYQLTEDAEPVPCGIPVPDHQPDDEAMYVLEIATTYGIWTTIATNALVDLDGTIGGSFGDVSARYVRLRINYDKWVFDGNGAFDVPTKNTLIKVYDFRIGEEEEPPPDCTDPDAPTGLAVEGECSEGGSTLTLSWDAVPGAVGYEAEDVTRGFLVYSGADTTCEVSNLTPGGTYAFRVRTIGQVVAEQSFTVDAANDEWTDSGLDVAADRNLRFIVSGVVVFNNGLTPNWYAYAEGAYTPPGDDNDFGLVDYYDPGQTFDASISQISADTRPHSLAAVVSVTTPPNTAGSVSGGLQTNRFAHFAAGSFTPGRVWLIQNDEEGLFGDNEGAYTVTVQEVLPCDVSAWSDSVPGTPGINLVGDLALSGELSCCGRYHMLTWAAAGIETAYELYHVVAGEDVLIYEGALLTFRYELRKSERPFSQEYRLQVVNACGESGSASLALGPLYRTADACDTGFGETDGAATVYGAPGCGEG